MEDFYRILPGEARKYYKKRSSLCFSNSTFNACAEYECDAGCCKDKIGEEVTAFDLIAMALVSKKLPSELFTKDVVLKADLLEIPGKIIPTLQLKTPCTFLLENRCSINIDKTVGKYVGKPLACVAFPENLYAADQLGVTEEQKAKDPKSFSIEENNYPCLKNRQEVSKERIKALLALEKIYVAERRASNIYFGIEARDCSMFLPKNLNRPNSKESKQFLDQVQHVFAKEFAEGSSFYAQLEERIKHLDNREGIRTLFSLM